MALMTAAAAGSAAVAMYLDAKYHLIKDVRQVTGRNRIQKRLKEAEDNNRACLYYLFEEAALANRDRECIWSRTGCYTWSETHEKVHQYAQFFLSKNVRPGDLVAFYLQNSPEFLFAWVALWEIGAAPAMINYNLAGEALVHCLEIGKVREGRYTILIDGHDAVRARIEDVRGILESKLEAEIVVLNEETKAHIATFESKRSPDELRRDVKLKSPCALFYTSGTTGMPKGCPAPVMAAHAGGISRKAGTSFVKPEDRWYNCMPLYHGTGGMSTTTCLLQGTVVCIGARFSVKNFWSEVCDSRATWITYVGETARYLLAQPPSPLDKAHCVRGMYGNGLRPDVWSRFIERFGIEVVGEFFNSTESMVQLSNHSKNSYTQDCVGHYGLIMRLKNRNVYVPVLVDPATGDLARDPATGFAIRQPHSVGGEIIVQIDSESAFAGYYKAGFFINDQATEKMFVRDCFTKGDLYYRSGDALRMDDEGRWFFMDRLGDTFRWKGENVSTAEVAQVLGRWEGVVEANVYGVQIPGHDGRAGCAAIFVDGGKEAVEKGVFDLKGFLNHSRTHLPKYAVPIFLRIVAAATPTHNNKQNKVPLRNEGVDPDLVDGRDVLYWVRPGGQTYVRYGREDWEGLKGGRCRL